MHKSAELFNKRVSQCLDMARVDYGNIFDIPEKGDILLNYEYMSGPKLAHTSLIPKAKSVQNIISLNSNMVEKHWSMYEKEIIPHELAHVICLSNNADDGHGVTWGEICLSMGGVDNQFVSLREEK